MDSQYREVRSRRFLIHENEAGPVADTLAPMPGSPFTSPGASPPSDYVNDESSILVVVHGSDATARIFTINGDMFVDTGDISDFLLYVLAGACRSVRRRASPAERVPSDDCLTQF